MRAPCIVTSLAFVAAAVRHSHAAHVHVTDDVAVRRDVLANQEPAGIQVAS